MFNFSPLFFNAYAIFLIASHVVLAQTLTTHKKKVGSGPLWICFNYGFNNMDITEEPLTVSDPFVFLPSFP